MLKDSPFTVFVNPMEHDDSLESFLRKSSPPEVLIIKMEDNRLTRDLGIGALYCDKNDDSNQWFKKFKILFSQSKVIMALPLIKKGL